MNPKAVPLNVITFEIAAPGLGTGICAAARQAVCRPGMRLFFRCSIRCYPAVPPADIPLFRCCYFAVPASGREDKNRMSGNNLAAAALLLNPCRSSKFADMPPRKADARGGAVRGSNSLLIRENLPVLREFRSMRRLAHRDRMPARALDA